MASQPMNTTLLLANLGAVLCGNMTKLPGAVACMNLRYTMIRNLNTATLEMKSADTVMAPAVILM